MKIRHRAFSGDDNPNGTVTFATDVVAKMANLAATEVEGVAQHDHGQ